MGQRTVEKLGQRKWIFCVCPEYSLFLVQIPP